jgi:hypothetical protein
MAKYPYKQLGVKLDRDYRNALNDNFKNIETDLVTEKQRVDNALSEHKDRVDTLINEVEQPSEVVDSRGGFGVLRDRLDDSDAQLAQTMDDTEKLNKRNESFKSPKEFGAIGDGITDDSQGIVDAFQIGRVNLGDGSYYVAANGVVDFEGVVGLIIDGNKVASLFNNTKTGDSGTMLRFANCKDIIIKNTKIYADTNNHNAYDNALVLKNCENFTIEDNQFLRTSNKHIHIEGDSKNIKIRNNTFEEAHFNTNPTVSNSYFGAIWIHYENSTATNISNVVIEDNVFKNIPLFAISSSNFEAVAGSPNSIRDIKINRNTLENCSNAFACRGRNIQVKGNTFRNCGQKNVEAYYTWDSELSRYFSKFRESKGQIPSSSNTVTFQKSGIIFMNNSLETKVEDNEFVNCAEWQTNPDNPLTISFYIDGRKAKYGSIKNNRFIDEQATTVPNAHGMWFGNAGEETNYNVFENNTFIMNPSVAPLKSMIRNDISTNIVKGNKLYNASNSLLYTGVVNEREIIFMNNNYYELNVDSSTLEVTGAQRTIGTDF